MVRSNSKRLPNKCFMNFGKVNILEHIIQRCKHYGITPIVCTSNLKSDKKIIDIAKKNNIRYFRGSSQNKIMRLSKCCQKFKIKMFRQLMLMTHFFVVMK